MNRNDTIDTFEDKKKSMREFVELTPLTERKSRALNTEEGRARKHLRDFYNGIIVDDNLIKSLDSNIKDREKFDEWQNKYEIQEVSLAKKLCLYLLANEKGAEGAIKYWLLIPDKQTVASRFKEDVTKIWRVITNFYNEFIKSKNINVEVNND